jgi:hypothetical protein
MYISRIWDFDDDIRHITFLLSMVLVASEMFEKCESEENMQNSAQCEKTIQLKIDSVIIAFSCLMENFLVYRNLTIIITKGSIRLRHSRNPLETYGGRYSSSDGGRRSRHDGQCATSAERARWTRCPGAFPGSPGLLEGDDRRSRRGK